MSAGRRISLTQGVLAAFVFSIAGAVLFAVLGPFLGNGTVLRGVVSLLGLAYVFYIVGRSGERVGRISTIACWLVCAAAVWYADLSLLSFVLVHAGLIWLTRSLFQYAGLIPALIDLGLSLFSVVFAIWAAQRTDSFGLALWCFFLVQAFHILIPERIRSIRKPAEPRDAFTRAHRAAEDAVRKLSGVIQ